MAPANNAERDSAQFEYVVVGSGAGGGTVAARLAELGHKVLILEAGGDCLVNDDAPGSADGDPYSPEKSRLPCDYDVPVFHAFASENNAMKWDFFVRHYNDTELQKKDPKYVEYNDGKRVDGVLYPRAGTLGGCTTHNAMITVYPHNADWDYIAELTGDRSWAAGNMRKYFERMERCDYRPAWRFWSKFGWNPTRHGFKGWFQTEVALPVKVLLGDEKLLKTIAESAEEAFVHNAQPFERLIWGIEGKGDPNDWRLVRHNAVGIHYPPLATKKHRRHGARERVLDVMKQYPDNLKVELNALASRVILDDNNRAIGVEYLKGAKLYRAHFNPSDQPGEKREVYASREVILAGGAFNTPQLLKLSGIGPRQELDGFEIPVRVELDGVGKNLQDRYEVGVVNRMNFDHWEVLKDAKFAMGDPQYTMWEKGLGVYTTNGAVIAVILRSLKERPLPDLFCFALLGLFRGYFPGYSKLFPEHLNYLTWAILKAHTENTAGTVTLRSADPRDVPQIDFRYFAEGNDKNGADLVSVIEGIKFVRKMTRPLIDQGLIAEEELPGKELVTDEQLADYVRYYAWGHHASCSCPIGDPKKGGVVNGNFEVHGTQGLRVVDASIFPKIPGFFIVTSIYMIAEKAADVISKAAR